MLIVTLLIYPSYDEINVDCTVSSSLSKSEGAYSYSSFLLCEDVIIFDGLLIKLLTVSL